MRKWNNVSSCIITWLRTFFAVTILTFIASSFLVPATYAQDSSTPKEGRFDAALSWSVASIHNNIATDQSGIGVDGTNSVFGYLKRFLNLIIPVIIIVGVVVVFIGVYKMMSTEKEDAIQEGGRLVIYGVIGIIIMVSADFLAETLTATVIEGSIDGNDWFNGLKAVNSLYETIFYPLLKGVAYLASGFLFFILATRAFSFLVSEDESVKKKAAWVIIRSVIGIIIILAANQIVTAVFGEQNKVINQTATDLGDIGTSIYETQTIPIVYSVINRIMGLATFVVLALIIFQTFQLLTKPDNPDNIQKIKKTLLYVAIGVLTIGSGYVISNVLIVN